MITSRPDLDAESALDDGPRGGFSGFVRRHQGRIWRYLRLLGADPDEADDLMQETFLRLPFDSDWQDWQDQQDRQRPEAYLRTIARHLLIDARRRASRRPPPRRWSAAVDELVAAEADLLIDERVDALRTCLERLGGKARAAVERHYLEGWDYRTVGQELGLRLNGLKTLLARTRRSLRECITKEMT